MKKIFSLCLVAMMAIVAMAQYPKRVYLCGPATSTAWAASSNPMFTNLTDGQPNGTYEWVGDLNSGDLKLLYGTQWEPGYAPMANGEALNEGVHTIVDRKTTADPDDKWMVEVGRYRLVLSLIDSTLTVSDGTGMETLNGEDQVFLPEVLYPIGTACQAEWNPADAAEWTVSAEGAAEGELLLLAAVGGEYELKFLCQRDWGLHYGPAMESELIGGEGTYSLARHENGDFKYKVSLPEDKTFVMQLNLNDGSLILTEKAPTALQTVRAEQAVQKQMVNGSIRILKNGQAFDLVGRQL